MGGEKPELENKFLPNFLKGKTSPLEMGVVFFIIQLAILGVFSIAIRFAGQLITLGDSSTYLAALSAGGTVLFYIYYSARMKLLFKPPHD